MLNSFTWWRAGVFCLSFLSGFVLFEPSPHDILLLCFVFVIMFSGYFIISEHMIPVIVIMNGFILFNMVPLLYVVDLEISLIYLSITIYLIISLLFYEIIISRAGSDIVRTLLKGYISACIISCFVSIFCFVVPNPISEIVLYGKIADGGRIKAFFKDPNVFGPFLVPAFMLCACSWRSIFSSRIFTSLRWFFVLVLLVSIILSGSRGGWLNLLVAIVALGWVHWNAARQSPRLRRRTPVPIVALAAVAGLAYALVTLVGYDEFLTDRFEQKSYDQDRFLAQSLALEEAMASPFGIGPGQSETYEGSSSLLRAPYSPHSLYVRVIAESGWGGAVSFLVFLLLTIRQAWWIAVTDWRYASISAVVFASLVGILANSFFVDTLHWRHFWMLLGMTWGLSGLCRRELAPLTQRAVIRAK